jgi:prepilin-type N-terminal cleavage/methylation domain-containing protein
MKHGRFCASQGFSLPEVLVATAVFGVAGAAVASVLTLNVTSNRLSSEITQATSYGQDKIEIFRTQATAPTTDTSGETSGIFKRTWVVTNGPSGLSASMKQVTVTVTWRDLGERSVRLQTYVSY